MHLLAGRCGRWKFTCQGRQLLLGTAEATPTGITPQIAGAAMRQVATDRSAPEPVQRCLVRAGIVIITSMSLRSRPAPSRLSFARVSRWAGALDQASAGQDHRADAWCRIGAGSEITDGVGAAVQFARRCSASAVGEPRSAVCTKSA